MMVIGEGEGALVSSNPTMATILDHLDAAERRVLEDLIQSIDKAATLRIEDIWDVADLPSSHWLLVMTGLDHEDELAIATELLQWREFSAQGSARVVCVPSSDRRRYSFVTSALGITKCPTLVISDSPNMAAAIKIESPLLTLLVSKRGNFRKLLNEVHTAIEQGTPLNAIARDFRREDLTEKARLAYSEVKSLVTITLKRDV